MEWLKLLLNNASCKVTRIVLVLDNIEAIREWDVQVACVKDMLELWSCLKNNDQRRYSVDAMMLARPDSVRHLSKDPAINTYAIENPIVLDTTPPLDELFRQRFDALIRVQGVAFTKPEKWQQAYNVLVNVSKALSIRAHEADLVCRLCNYDLGATLLAFDRLLANRRWIQKGLPVSDQGAFEVRKQHFTTDELPYLKALIYANTDRYYNLHNGLIQNVLKNVEDPSHDLVPLLLQQYFLSHTEEGKSPDYQYCHINPLLISVDGILPQEGASKAFSQTLRYYEERGLVIESAWSKPDDRIFAMTPRCVAIIDLIGSNSLLLEAFRDDLWCNHGDECLKPTTALTENQLWTSLVNILVHYLRAEKVLLESIVDAGATRHYTSFFGNDSLTEAIFRGVAHSYHAHFADEHARDQHHFQVAKQLRKDIHEILNAEFSHE